MNLGIGVITRNRRNEVTQVLDALEAHTTTPYRLAVGVDLSVDGTVEMLRERYADRPDVQVRETPERGIPANRNIVVDALKDCDILVVFEDDYLPYVDGWELPLIDALTSGQTELVVGLSGIHGAVTAAAKAGRANLAWRPNMTCQMIALTSKVIKVAGYWHPGLARYGFDDGDYVIRARTFGLTGTQPGFPCLADNDDYFRHIPNPASSDMKTWDQRQADISANLPLFIANQHNPRYVPYPY